MAVLTRCTTCGETIEPDDGGAIWYHTENMSMMCDGDDSTDIARQAAPPTKLTRAQLAALADLHRVGAVAVVTRFGGYWHKNACGDGTKLRRVAGTTSTALRQAGLARFPNVEGSDSVDFVDHLHPALAPWADGFGNWHVNVPADITNGRAVARAVIAGEVWARESQAYIDDWQPRLERVAPDRTTPAGTVEYRETAA